MGGAFPTRNISFDLSFSIVQRRSILFFILHIFFSIPFEYISSKNHRVVGRKELPVGNGSNLSEEAYKSQDKKFAMLIFFPPLFLSFFSLFPTIIIITIIIVGARMWKLVVKIVSPLESIPPEVGLGARIRYNHGRVGEHLQPVHVDRV